MRRQTWSSTGRRGTVFVASAAVLCLGGALAACGAGTGGGGGDGYVAVGAAGTGPEKAPTGAVAPSGKVTLIPLDSAGSDGGGGDAGGGAEPKPGSSAQSGAPGGAGATGDGTQAPGSSGAATGGSTGSASSSGSGDTGGTGSADGTGGTGSGDAGSVSQGPSAPSAPGPTAPAGPAVLTLSAPERAVADDRWCEKVTVEFRNTGGSPVRSGTVTFATHIIGALGIDWATIESTAPLPAPIDAGAALKKTYTVCVDAWRVPLGMHIETRDVTAVWK
ncbi:hypothetical protein [Streptomyces sp. 061-3]|uniref:hypothetical protein n=1 Tax=Streptomyces sp. 061-3 TaxID=2789268 RepID=UPI0039805407